MQYMRSEASIMEQVKSEQENNLLQIIDYKETKNHLYILMEYCPIDLNQLVKKYLGVPLKEESILTILKQLLRGLKELHDKKIMHRDLKIDNIMIKTTQKELEKLQGKYIKEDEFISTVQFKLADFGLSKQLVKDDMTWTQAGSKMNMAPEVIMSKPYTYSADIYSLGVITYYLATGSQPHMLTAFDDPLPILKQPIRFPSNCSLSFNCQAMIRGMLAFHSKDRLSVTSLIELLKKKDQIVIPQQVDQRDQVGKQQNLQRVESDINKYEKGQDEKIREQGPKLYQSQNNSKQINEDDKDVFELFENLNPTILIHQNDILKPFSTKRDQIELYLNLIGGIQDLSQVIDSNFIVDFSNTFTLQVLDLNGYLLRDLEQYKNIEHLFHQLYDQVFQFGIKLQDMVRSKNSGTFSNLIQWTIKIITRKACFNIKSYVKQEEDILVELRKFAINLATLDRSLSNRDHSKTLRIVLLQNLSILAQGQNEKLLVEKDYQDHESLGKQINEYLKTLKITV